MLSDCVLYLEEHEKSTMEPRLKKEARREEDTARGIYGYIIENTKDHKVIATLTKMVKEEKHHMEIVKALK